MEVWRHRMCQFMGKQNRVFTAPTERRVSPAKWVLVGKLAAFMGSFRIFMKCQHGMDVEGNDQVNMVWMWKSMTKSKCLIKD